MDDSTRIDGAQVARVANFPLQPRIAHDRAAAAVRKLMAGNLDVDTSVDHLGLYAADMTWLRWQVSLTRGRPC